MAGIEMLAVVAVLQNLPEHALVRSQAGTVAEDLALVVGEVEFRGTYAMSSLKADHLT